MVHVSHNNEGSRCQNSHSVICICSDSLSLGDENEKGQGVTQRCRGMGKFKMSSVFKVCLYIAVLKVKDRICKHIKCLNNHLI